MSEAKFTKGKWCIRLVNGQFTIMRHDTGYGICSTVMCDDTDKANANLIAAAPEMYAMLNKLIQPYGMEDFSHDEVEQLLAKARGE